MELSYWRSKWRKGQIGFHMKDGYPELETYWSSVRQGDKSAVLVPLCGKSKDLIWLSEHSEKVVGAEISELAVKRFFKENSLRPEITTFADFKIYRAKNIEIWNGDFFKLPKQKLPSFDTVFDRAALVALPSDMRARYISKIKDLTSSHVNILLHLYTYPQEEMNGPPFSVSPDEVKKLFGPFYQVKILKENELNLNNYKKFQNRGLQSYFIEFLLLLLPVEE